MGRIWHVLCSCLFWNLSWQYMNSMSWIVIVGDGVIGVCVWFEAPIMHRMYGLSLATGSSVSIGPFSLVIAPTSTD